MPAPSPTIGILHDYGRADPSEMLARITEDDILAGAATSPGSRLAILVSHAIGPARVSKVRR
jgi:hypothetical protein